MVVCLSIGSLTLLWTILQGSKGGVRGALEP